MRRFVLAGLAVLSLAAPALATPADDVRAALVNFSQATSYHLTLDASGKHGEGDVVVPDKMQLTIGPMKMIKIGTTTWVYVNGHWMEMSMAGDSLGRMTGGVTEAQSLSKDPKDVTVTDLGPKTVDGETFHAYSVQNKGASTPSILYIGSDGRLRRIDSTNGRADLDRALLAVQRNDHDLASPAVTL